MELKHLSAVPWLVGWRKASNMANIIASSYISLSVLPAVYYIPKDTFCRIIIKKV